MQPIKVELPAATPADLRDELVDALEGLGSVYEPGAKTFSMEAAMLILAGISAAADVLTTAALLLEWREKARGRGVPLDKVIFVAGDQRFTLLDTDTQTLAHILEGLRET